MTTTEPLAMKSPVTQLDMSFKNKSPALVPDDNRTCNPPTPKELNVIDFLACQAKDALSPAVSKPTFQPITTLSIPPSAGWGVGADRPSPAPGYDSPATVSYDSNLSDDANSLEPLAGTALRRSDSFDGDSNTPTSTGVRSRTASVSSLHQLLYAAKATGREAIPAHLRVMPGRCGQLPAACHGCGGCDTTVGWAVCPLGHDHTFCQRCVESCFLKDFSLLLARPETWECPACTGQCASAHEDDDMHAESPTRLAEGAKAMPPSSAMAPRRPARVSHEHIKKGWSDSDTAMLIALVHEHTEHKNKWKLVAARMPDARTPGQVKEKYHRLTKSLDFASLQARVLANPQLYLPRRDPNEEPFAPAPLGRPTICRLPSEESMGSGGTSLRPTSSRRAKRPREEEALTLPMRGGEPRLAEESALRPEAASHASPRGGEMRLMRSKKSASGFRGVSRAGSRWEAYIGNGTSGKRYIGRFDTVEEAAAAYAEAFSELNGGGELDAELEDEDVSAWKRTKRQRREIPAYWAESPGSDGEPSESGGAIAGEEAAAGREEAMAARPAPSRRGSLPSISMPQSQGRAVPKPGGKRSHTPTPSFPPVVLPEGVELIRSPHAASGFQGVSRAGSKWEAYLSGGPGKVGKKYIGRFGTPEEAATAYALEVRRLKRDGGI